MSGESQELVKDEIKIKFDKNFCQNKKVTFCTTTKGIFTRMICRLFISTHFFHSRNPKIQKNHHKNGRFGK
jgi:hypothetical protein